jgi:hypothetical protein
VQWKAEAMRKFFSRFDVLIAPVAFPHDQRKIVKLIGASPPSMFETCVA